MFRFVKKHNTLFISLGFLVIFSFAVAHANPPTSAYTAGSTLDPQCAPGATNCTVTVGASSFTALTNTPTTLAGYGITDTYTKTAADARYPISTGAAGGQTIIGGTGTTDSLSLVGTSGNGNTASNALQFKVGNNGGTTAMFITNGGSVGIGSTSASGTLTIGGVARSSTAWGTAGIGLQVRSTAYTDSSSSGTVTNAAINSLGVSSISSSNLAVYSNASTLYIAGAPSAGTNASITNPWAINVAGGDVNFGGNRLIVGGVNEKVELVSSGGIPAGIYFNRDPTNGFILDTNGYAYQFTHTKSLVSTTDRFSLGIFSPSGTSVATPFTATAQGFVGINTITPTQALDINGNVQIDGNGHGLYFPDGSFISTNVGGAGVGTSSTTDLNFTADSDNNGSGVINFAVNGNGAMTIANNGYVGINTTTPSQSLTVNGNLQITGQGNGIYFADGSFMGSAANIGTGISAPGDISLVADTDDDGVGGISLSTGGNQHLALANNGNIALGNSLTTPSTTLQIFSSTGNGVMIGPGTYPSYMGTNGLYITGQLHASTNVLNSGSGINWGASQARIVGVNPGANSNSYLSFYTGSVAAQGERMRIIDNGDVGIGTITPDALLSIGSTLVPTATIVADYQNAGGTCAIDPSTTGGISCSSDMTLKKNITNLGDDSSWSFNTNITPSSQSTLDKVLALNPVDYNWNIESDGTTKHAGLIAQEVQEVFPDLVSRNATTNTLSLNYTGLVPYTVEAIKEMNLNVTNIDDLTKTNTWRDAITNWLADAANNITDIWAGTFHAKNEICINSTCINEDQLKAILQQQNTASNPNAPVTTTVTNDTTDTSSQSPEVDQPAVTTPDASTQSPQVDENSG